MKDKKMRNITTLMGIMSFNRKNSKEFTDVVINELEGRKWWYIR